MTPVFAKAYNPSEVHFMSDDCENRNEPRKVLMCTPEHFSIVDVKNIYMQGQKGNINIDRANIQWDAIRNSYLALKNQKIIDDVLVIDGIEGMEDMVFIANQSFPWVMWNGEKIAIMSRMRHENRQNEIPYVEDFYKDHGYKIVELQSKYHFEGMGDMIAHPGKRLLYGGYGFRSERAAYDEIARIVDAPIITLELISEHHYHLDTCFLPLNHSEVLIAPDAFSPESLNIIRRMFEGVYEIPEEEAIEGFACNAHMIYGTNKAQSAALVQRGNPVSLNILQQSASQVLEIDTTEFIKSGGSVFCLKMMVY